MEELKNDEPVVYGEILRFVRIIFVDAVDGILNINVERNNMSRETNVLPPVLPKYLFTIIWSIYTDK